MPRRSSRAWLIFILFTFLIQGEEGPSQPSDTELRSGSIPEVCPGLPPATPQVPVDLLKNGSSGPERPPCESTTERTGLKAGDEHAREASDPGSLDHPGASETVSVPGSGPDTEQDQLSTQWQERGDGEEKRDQSKEEPLDTDTSSGEYTGMAVLFLLDLWDEGLWLLS